MEHRRRRKKLKFAIILLLFIVLIAGIGIGIRYWINAEESTCSPQLSVELKPEKPDGIIYEENIQYAETKKNMCYLDIAYGEEEMLRPLLVFVHGGSWMKGSRTEMTNYLYTFSALGYAAATIDYDLCDFNDYVMGGFVSINDEEKLVSEAVSYLAEHASQYHIDTDRIVLIGHSAGGQLVGNLTERVSEHPEEYSYQLAGVVILAGATNMRTMIYEDYQLEEDVSIGLIPFIFDGIDENDVITELDKVDVMSNITEKLPPVLLVHGNCDTLVPLTMSQELYQSLKEIGVTTELVVVPGMSHILDEQAVSDAIYTYLTTYIQNAKEENE